MSITVHNIGHRATFLQMLPKLLHDHSFHEDMPAFLQRVVHILKTQAEPEQGIQRAEIRRGKQKVEDLCNRTEKEWFDQQLRDAEDSRPVRRMEKKNNNCSTDLGHGIPLSVVDKAAERGPTQKLPVPLERLAWQSQGEEGSRMDEEDEEDEEEWWQRVVVENGGYDVKIECAKGSSQHLYLRKEVAKDIGKSQGCTKSVLKSRGHMSGEDTGTRAGSNKTRSTVNGVARNGRPTHGHDQAMDYKPVDLLSSVDPTPHTSPEPSNVHLLANLAYLNEPKEGTSRCHTKFMRPPDYDSLYDLSDDDFHAISWVTEPTSPAESEANGTGDEMLDSVILSHVNEPINPDLQDLACGLDIDIEVQRNRDSKASLTWSIALNHILKSHLVDPKTKEAVKERLHCNGASHSEVNGFKRGLPTPADSGYTPNFSHPIPAAPWYPLHDSQQASGNHITNGDNAEEDHMLPSGLPTADEFEDYELNNASETGSPNALLTRRGFTILTQANLIKNLHATADDLGAQLNMLKDTTIPNLTSLLAKRDEALHAQQNLTEALQEEIVDLKIATDFANKIAGGCWHREWELWRWIRELRDRNQPAKERRCSWLGLFRSDSSERSSTVAADLLTNNGMPRGYTYDAFSAKGRASSSLKYACPQIQRRVLAHFDSAVGRAVPVEHGGMTKEEVNAVVGAAEQNLHILKQDVEEMAGLIRGLKRAKATGISDSRVKSI